MDKAIAETNQQKDKLMEDARKAVDILQSKQQKAMLDTRENFKKDMAQKTQHEVFEITRKALTELASVSLEEQAVKLFVRRIQELKGEGQQQFINAFKSASEPMLIQSAFELLTNQKQEIEKTVNEILGKQTTFQFKSAPEIISGIELITNGYKLEWSISSYLIALENNVTQTAEKEIETEEKANQQKELKEKV